MTKLIDQVQPVVLRSLDRSAKINYTASYRAIIASLESVNRGSTKESRYGDIKRIF